MEEKQDTDNTPLKNVVNVSYWTELYDPKEGRPIRNIEYTGKCKECEQYNGHRLDCSFVNLEQLAKMVKFAQKQEEDAKKQSKRYWNQLQRAIGRVAVLRHENNKLRKENDRLKGNN